MRRSLIPIALTLFAAALLAVPAALAKGSHHRTVSVRGVCTQQSTSKLKLSREHRRVEVEFEVDQNRNAIPWKVTLVRSGNRVASFRAVTHAPSGSFEIRRVVGGHGRISARATRPGESCRASAAAPRAGAVAGDDGARHDVGDDHGRDG